MPGQDLGKKVKAKIDKKDDFFRNIDEHAKIIDKYFDRKPDLKQNVPETRIIIFNKIAYPIVYDVNHFFYLGGKSLFFILKDKCILRETPTAGTRYYEAIPSEDDISIKKAPIIPIGCPKYKDKFYPGDSENLEKKL